MLILTLNAGSSSIKYKVFDGHEPILSGLIEGIGEASGYKDHQEAFSVLANTLKQDLKGAPIVGIGHRVVHGGNTFYQPTIITPEVLEQIEALSKLAPLHNPVNALGIRHAMKHFKDALQIAIFDTGFHHTLPAQARFYAIDIDIAKRFQIQRYGFHGINHEYVANTAAAYLCKPLSKCHFISLHLGNGASACLIKNGKSVDTSMGMTPLAGLIMGTRSGDIDPAIPLYLIEQGLTPQEVDTLLNKQSGLKGIAKDNDMRHVLAKAEAKDKNAILAIEMYVYVIQKTIGAYLSQLDKLDALIFTGGVGENASIIRHKILSPLKHFRFHLNKKSNETSSTALCHPITDGEKLALIIKSDEERLMSEKVSAFIE